MKKQFLTELKVLIGTLVISLALFILFFGSDSFFNDSLDIAIHDTYFILLPITVIGFIWLVLYFITNSIRQIRYRFYNVYANAMLVITSGILCCIIYSCIQLTQELSASLNGGLALYPPLSGLPQVTGNNNSVLNCVKNFLWIAEVFVLSVSILTVIMIVIRKKDKGKEIS
jgi:hypothetical protein